MQRGSGAPRIRHRDTRQDDGRRQVDLGQRTPRSRLLQEGKHLLGSTKPLRGRMEVLPDKPDRQVCLRSQNQDEEGHGERHLSLGESNADGYSHKGNRQAGQQLEGKRRQERDAKNAHRRAAITLTDGLDRLRLCLGAAEDLERR